MFRRHFCIQEKITFLCIFFLFPTLISKNVLILRTWNLFQFYIEIKANSIYIYIFKLYLLKFQFYIEINIFIFNSLFLSLRLNCQNF